MTSATRGRSACQDCVQNVKRVAHTCFAVLALLSSVAVYRYDHHNFKDTLTPFRRRVHSRGIQNERTPFAFIGLFASTHARLTFKRKPYLVTCRSDIKQGFLHHVPLYDNWFRSPLGAAYVARHLKAASNPCAIQILSFLSSSDDKAVGPCLVFACGWLVGRFSVAGLGRIKRARPCDIIAKLVARA